MTLRGQKHPASYPIPQAHLHSTQERLDYGPGQITGGQFHRQRLERSRKMDVHLPAKLIICHRCDEGVDRKSCLLLYREYPFDVRFPMPQHEDHNNLFHEV